MAFQECCLGIFFMLLSISITRTIDLSSIQFFSLVVWWFFDLSWDTKTHLEDSLMSTTFLILLNIVDRDDMHELIEYTILHYTPLYYSTKWHQDCITGGGI